MSIDHNIYNEITCEETHVLQPFSNQDAGATTIVVQRLILQGENVETLGEQLEISRRTSLLFDHVPSPKRTHGELRASRDLIKKMCKQSTDDVQIEFSDLFTKFIQTLRLLSYPSLSILYRHASTTCPTGKYVCSSPNYEAKSVSFAQLPQQVAFVPQRPDRTERTKTFSLATWFKPRTHLTANVARTQTRHFGQACAGL